MDASSTHTKSSPVRSRFPCLTVDAPSVRRPGGGVRVQDPAPGPPRALQGSALYYIDKTAGKLTGVQTIDGIPYTFDEYGCAVTGWVSYADGSLYFYNLGLPTATGWAVTENGTYYLTARQGSRNRKIYDRRQRILLR